MFYGKRLIWWLSAFWQRYSQIIIITSVLVVLVTYASNRLGFFSRQGQKIALAGRYTPNRLPLEVSGKISFGLTREINGKIASGIAKKWVIKEGGRVYVFQLADLYWHDGTKVKAADIKLKIKNSQIRALDDSTLEIRLKEPLASLPALLTRPLFKKGFIGVGDYRVVNFKSNSDGSLKYIVLERRQGLLELGNRYVTYVFYPNYEQAKTAFLLGEVDVLPNLLSAQEFVNFPNVRIEPTVSYDKLVMIYFNLNNPYLANKKLRQALAYGSYKFDAQYQRAISPIRPDSEFYNDRVNRYDFDLAKAKELFAKTGLATQSAKIKLSLMTPPDLLSVADKIKESWQAIDDRLVIRTQVVYDQRVDFDALLQVVKIPLDPDQYHLWHSTQGGNLTGLNSPKIDQFLEDGRRQVDPQTRKEIYLNFQKHLVDEVPAVMLFYPTTYTVKRKGRIELPAWRDLIGKFGLDLSFL